MPLIQGRVVDRRAVIRVGLQATPIITDGPTAVAAAAAIPIFEVRGLLDTGAQVTLVTHRVIGELGLRPRGRRPLGNVSNITMHRTYSFILGMWYSNDRFSPADQGEGYYAFEPILGCDFPDRPDFDVLIGMDIISRGDLTIRRNGEFELLL